MLAAFLLSVMMTVTPLHVLTVPIAHAEEKVWTQEMVKELARDTAKRYGLNTQKFLHTLNCENLFRAKGQSERVDSKGEREDSWGSAQINLYWNPNVTKEEAEDPSFAILWMAEEWNSGQAWKWSCWKDYNEIGWPEERL